jgi:hypothetical protein
MLCLCGKANQIENNKYTDRLVVNDQFVVYTLFIYLHVARVVKQISFIDEKKNNII